MRIKMNVAQGAGGGGCHGNYKAGVLAWQAYITAGFMTPLDFILRYSTYSCAHALNSTALLNLDRTGPLLILFMAVAIRKLTK